MCIIACKSLHIWNKQELSSSPAMSTCWIVQQKRECWTFSVLEGMTDVTRRPYSSLIQRCKNKTCFWHIVWGEDNIVVLPQGCSQDTCCSEGTSNWLIWGCCKSALYMIYFIENNSIFWIMCPMHVYSKIFKMLKSPFMQQPHCISPAILDP